MAKKWGVRVRADDVARINDPEGFTALIADALEARARAA
jgi:hypothetical protein